MLKKKCCSCGKHKFTRSNNCHRKHHWEENRKKIEKVLYILPRNSNVTVDVAQPTCLGCYLNPGFINPNPFTHDPFPYQNPSHPFQPQQYTNFPAFIDNLANVKLTPEETDLLKKLGECYNLYCSLDKRSESDNKEFVDAIHRLQQIIALRVARRVNPEVWAQPID